LLLVCDAENGVRDPTPPACWTLEANDENAQVVLRFNLRDSAQAGQAGPGKIKLFVDVRREQAVDAALIDANSQLTKWRGICPTTEVLLETAWLGPDGLGQLSVESAIEATSNLKKWLAGALRQL